MLGSQFKEGRELEANATIDLPLPEDDLSAMAVICEILHHQYDRSKQGPLDYALISKIALAADKYDCVTALKAYAECWINGHREKANLSELHSLFIAAYHFQHGNLFHELSKDLVKKSDRPLWRFEEPVDDSCPDIIAKVLCRCKVPT